MWVSAESTDSDSVRPTHQGQDPATPRKPRRRGRRRGKKRGTHITGNKATSTEPAGDNPAQAAAVPKPGPRSSLDPTPPPKMPVTPSDVRSMGSGGNGVKPGGKPGQSKKKRPRAPKTEVSDPASKSGRTTTPRLRTVRETSAGGLVVNGFGSSSGALHAALIGRVDRRGRILWSLPKGHIETGETAEQTAIREVAEETGIEGKVVATLGKIDYWFVSEGKRIHKTVHHYLMRFTGGELSAADYEVSEVAWVPLDELPRRLTYSDERRLARTAADVIADLSANPDLLAQSEAERVRTEPNAYERAAAARNQRRNDSTARPAPAARDRRRHRSRRKRSDSQGRDTAGDQT